MFTSGHHLLPLNPTRRSLAYWTMFTALSAVFSLLGVFLIQHLLKLRRIARNLGNLSGPRFLFNPSSAPGQLTMRVLPPIPYVNSGGSWMLAQKYQDFAIAGQDAALLITDFPQPKCTLFLADPAAIKEVTTYRARFPKPVELYAALSVFGRNIVASEGEEWKRYRKVAAPAFSERNNKLVWDETVLIMKDLFDNVWGNKSEVVVDHGVDITLPIALFVIGVAGFGRRVTWTSDLVPPPGHQMALKDALHILSNNVLMKIILPNWAWGLTKHTREVQLAFIEFKQYMIELVDARRNAKEKEERYDLFSGLVDAARDEQGDGAAISDEELLGNVFIFLLAGHETAAHTLCFTFALLALHPDEQERLYQQIKSVTSSLDRAPGYEDMGRFTYSLAVFYETLRMFPPAPSIPKEVAEDTTLTVTNADGGKTTFPVPSGTEINLHVPGLHYNPRYWKDPHAFKPERFLGDWPKDAFIPFSLGARACLGRRFFETEGIAVMTMLVSNYKIEIKEEPEFAGETFEQRFARITAFDQGLTTIAGLALSLDFVWIRDSTTDLHLHLHCFRPQRLKALNALQQSSRVVRPGIRAVSVQGLKRAPPNRRLQRDPMPDNFAAFRSLTVMN
ncbi:cytochrome P450 [Multifurca ochricompacta]|uniref:Cytochrome P450 n=1 Tax=Multifurca ochricompacta TaxID=376703 RepID=A0AAD4QL71_9AGAM|nr:cytochrome P450 [Multifurca ochricompacta]